MAFPFRNNPKIITNWFHNKTKKFVERKQKKAYYGIAVKKGWLKIEFREEKKRLGGSQELERHWVSYLQFELNTQFAKDLKMFLREHMEAEDIFKPKS
ncbi:MAG: hypothetical protein KAS32_18820 [Candidatus Peribacteraceae bacterium]|nr:hypothetical protein [Candidatus Peribacteraceae bacterium]